MEPEDQNVWDKSSNRSKLLFIAILGLITLLSGYRVTNHLYVEKQWKYGSKTYFHPKFVKKDVDSLSKRGVSKCSNGQTFCPHEAERQTAGEIPEQSLNVTTEKDEELLYDPFEEKNVIESQFELPACPEKSPLLLGRRDFEKPEIHPDIKKIEEANPLVVDGGHFMPPDCEAKSKVAIVIPYRNREKHLIDFLCHMHPLLQRQQLDYRIYVINQFGTSTFNRGKLVNIGFAEMKKDYDYDCIVIHDVDLLLENDHASYKCPSQPRHLAAALKKFNYTIVYEQYFGGVTEISTEQFELINGFSNNFWGWGGEDDNLLFRVRLAGLRPSRYSANISRYYSEPHGRDVGNEKNPDRFDKLMDTFNSIATDGLNALKYTVIAKEKYKLYTNITVDLLAPSESMIAKEEDAKRKGVTDEFKKKLSLINFDEVLP